MENLEKSEIANEGTLQNFFVGASIPVNYDAYMGPMVFDTYALDLVGRLEMTKPVSVLELACGTGGVTKHILSNLPRNSALIATDISEDMMDVAKQTIDAPNLLWKNVDMSSIPSEDNMFDIVICQFGLMFVPDKLVAIKEMFRVLKPGGQLLFNTWGNLDQNPIWKLSFKILREYLGGLPFAPEMGPFGLQQPEPVLELLKEAGFASFTATSVYKTAIAESAEHASTGYLLVSPVIQKKPELFPIMHEVMVKDFKDAFGNETIKSPLLAQVFEARK